MTTRAADDYDAIRDRLTELRGAKREPEEGGACDCGGRFVFKPNGDCSCHISPPCGSCEEAFLVCDQCGDEP